jgi:TRAP-type C4-dicarboxylate transport system substrate-binding protein
MGAVACGSDKAKTSATDDAPASGVSATTPATTEARVDKAGNAASSDPVRLTAACYCGEDRPQGKVGVRFAEEVANESGGSMEIDFAFDVDDAWQQFQAGKVDMLLTPTRAMDTMGVHSFDVLSIPFVVSDDEQADRVVQDPVVDTMMVGLDGIGATGLLLAPAYQTHLAIAGDAPLRHLDQLHTGLRLAPPGDLTDEMYTALGATPTRDLNADGWDAAVADGTATASEWPIHLAGSIPGPQNMAANFALFYDFELLAIDNDSLGRLDDGQRNILTKAAAVAQQRSIEERVRDDVAFRDACTQGGSLTAAPSTFVTEVGRALDDWILGKLEDPATKQIYDTVKRAAGAHAVPRPQECHGGTTTDYRPPAPPSTTFPEGAYRSQPHTGDGLLAAGVSSETASSNDAWDYADVAFTDGSLTLSFHKQSGSTDQECTAPYTTDTQGRITIAGDCLGGTYTWYETPEGISLEMITSDDVQRQVDWDVSTLITTDMVRVS